MGLAAVPRARVIFLVFGGTANQMAPILVETFRTDIWAFTVAHEITILALVVGDRSCE